MTSLFGQQKSVVINHAVCARGFTLVELALVLGVMGLITAGLWWATGNAQEARRETDAYNELQTVVQNMDTLYMGRQFTNPLGTSIVTKMINAHIVPSIYVNSMDMTKADNPWFPAGLNIYTNALGMTSSAYRVSFYNTTFNGCVGMLMRATRCHVGQIGCPLKVYTNSSAYERDPTGAGLPDWAQTMQQTDAAKACNANTYPGGSGVSNSVEFDFPL